MTDCRNDKEHILEEKQINETVASSAHYAITYDMFHLYSLPLVTYILENRSISKLRTSNKNFRIYIYRRITTNFQVLHK
jgi:hypothetical protein